METADFRGKAGKTQTHARRCSAFPRGAGRIGCAARSAQAGRAHERRCSGGKLSARALAHAVLRGAVGAGGTTFAAAGAIFLLSAGKPRQCAAPAYDAMVTSFHFPGRPGKETKQRKGAAGQAKNPCRPSPGRRSAQPVIPCQRISGLNVGATFRRDNTGCGTRPVIRSPAGASCAATGVFLMAGVTKPLTVRAANTVRRLKNKRAAHTVRPAPTPGSLILALTFPIHFDSLIKEFPCLRTFPIHSPASSTPTHNGKHPRMASKREADTTFLKCTYTDFSRLISSCVRET